MSRRKYLCGEHLTEAGVRLFPPAFRHDAVYYIYADEVLPQDGPRLPTLTPLVQTHEIKSWCPSQVLISTLRLWVLWAHWCWSRAHHCAEEAARWRLLLAQLKFMEQKQAAKVDELMGLLPN
jgi:hypothetical protein